MSLKQSMKYGLLDNTQRLLRKAPRTEDLRLGEFWALRNVSLELKKGDALGVMGVNGSGKTTLLRLMNGLYAPDVGHIAIKGRVGAMIAAGAVVSASIAADAVDTVHIADDAVEREIDKEKRRPKPPVSASQPTNNNK